MLPIITFFDNVATQAAVATLKTNVHLDHTTASMVASFDSSHSITHLRNTWWLSGIVSRDAHPSVYEIATTAAKIHDCMDHKYLSRDHALENEKILRDVLKASMAPEAIDTVFKAIASSSFSVRRARLAAGEPEFPLEIEEVCKIVSDADLLEAYDPRRVIAFQANRWPDNLAEQRAWSRTIFEKRILRYRDDWMRTDAGKKLAVILHPQLEEWITHPDQQAWWATAELRPY